MDVSPAENSNRIVYYKIESNGKEIDKAFRFSYFCSSNLLNHIGKATLKFDTGSVEKMSFDESDGSTFQPGVEIRVYAGYTKGKEELIYEGVIISQSLEIQGTVRPQLVVECRDYTFAATRGRKNAVFEEMCDGDIICKILKPYGLSCTVEKSTMNHHSLIQYYCSDWDFIRARAEANGLVISVKGKNVTVKKPEVNQKAVLNVEYGNDLISFNGSLSATDQYSQVVTNAWDFDNQEVISALASSPTLNNQGDLSASKLQKAGGDKMVYQTDSFIVKSSLKVWADSISLRNGLSRYQGDFSFVGNAAPFPGCIVVLSKLGKRFDGNVYVGGVEHTIEKDLWHTRIIMGLPSDNVTDLPDVVAPAASGYLPGIEGLHIGKVKKVEDDPLSQNRIWIELPLLNGVKNTVWARLSTLYASSNAGSVFLPEAGDEVVVGFFNDDPCSPVILGSLFSKKKVSPYKPGQRNDMKAFVTREKMKIEFNEEKKIITISTPGNNSIEINDDKSRIRLSDQHKNEIVMDRNGILFNSSKDIVLKAKGNISMEAMKMDMNAKLDVGINGMNVKVAAKMGVSMKGNATAELSASGQTTVKGGIVMIN